MQLFTVTRAMARSTPTVIKRKHYSLVFRQNFASFHSSYSTFLLHVMFIEIINVDKVINAFT